MKFLTALVTLLITNAAVAQDAAISIPILTATTSALRKALVQVEQLRTDGTRQRIVVTLPGGEYTFRKTLQLTPQIVGDGLTLTTETPGSVIFSAAVRLAPSHTIADGHWRFTAPQDILPSERPRVMLIDDRLTSAARFPETGTLRIQESLKDRRCGFIVGTDELPASLKIDGNDCDLVFLHDWSSSRLPIASYDPANRELRTIGPIGCSADHYAIDHFEKQPRYWLEGHPSFATKPGEWFFDRETSEIVVTKDPENLTPPSVKLPLLNQILNASGNTTDQPLTGLHLQNITFTGTTFPMPDGGLAGAQATMHEPRNAAGARTTKHRPMLEAAVHIAHANGCRLTNCLFEHMGTSGLWISQHSSNNTVFRCKVDHVGGNGINMGEDNSRSVNGKSWYQSAPDQIPSDNRITECEISHCGQLLPGAVAIWAPLNHKLKIDKNHIHDCPYTGISLGWIWNDSKSLAGDNHIHGNLIEYVMQTLSDGGGIYTLGRQPDSIIEGNTITDVPLNAGRAESNAMFLDQGSAGFTIHDNTIRRITKSPIRFHQAAKNTVKNNRWELATVDTPPVRFNNTPAGNITVDDNKILKPQLSVLMIGNSLTWDTRPQLLDGHVHWHVDCGKNLTFIKANPAAPCVASSRLWPTAMSTTQYDFVSVQPHYGTTLEDDIAVISEWVKQQQKAIFVIHTGWAKHEFFEEERRDSDAAGELTHSDVYFDTLLQRLRKIFPDREFRSTRAMNLLFQLSDDVKAGTAPFNNLTDAYRDAIHMKTETGRYLMHNAVRTAIGQPVSAKGSPEIDPKVRSYLDGLLQRHAAE